MNVLEVSPHMVFVKWKKEVQKEMKESGYRLKYSHANNEFDLFLSYEVNHFPYVNNVAIRAKVNIGQKNGVRFNFSKYEGSFVQTYEERMAEVAIFFLERVEEYFSKEKMELSYVEVSGEPDVFNDYLTRRGFHLRRQEKGLKYFFEDVGIKRMERMENIIEEIKKMVKSPIWMEQFKQVEVIRKDIIRELVELRLEGIVERTIRICGRTKEIEIESAYFLKVYKVEEINIQWFEEKLEKFYLEERLSKLIVGPKMNSISENSIKSMLVYEGFPYKKEELFNILLSAGITVEQLNTVPFDGESAQEEMTNIQVTNFKEDTSRKISIKSYEFCGKHLLLTIVLNNQSVGIANNDKKLYIFDTFEEVHCAYRNFLVKQI